MVERTPGRRDALRLAGLLGAGAVASFRPPKARACGPASAAARVNFTYAPDVVLFCNPTVAHAFRRVGDLYRAQTRVALRILATADRIFAAQLARGERNDICITLASVAADMQSAGLIDPQPAAGAWRDRLVIARAGGGPASVDIAMLPALLASGRLGVTDPTGNAIVDTPGLLDRLGLTQALAGRLVGAVDTGGVAYLLAHRSVDLGLIFTTDQRAGRFAVAAEVADDAYQPVRYAAVLNKHVLSRNAAAFLAFLATPAARARLAESGLETAT